MCSPLTGVLAACTASRGKELRTVERIELACFMGPWRVIACVNNAAEHEMVDAVETYTLRADGGVEVHCRWREKSFNAPEQGRDFVGQVMDAPTNARWKMKLFPLLSASYVIIAVHPQYEWAAVAHPSRKFGWVLARGRTLPDRTYREIMRVFEQEGYDTRNFIKVPQLVVSDSYPRPLPRAAFSCA